MLAVLVNYRYLLLSHVVTPCCRNLGGGGLNCVHQARDMRRTEQPVTEARSYHGYVSEHHAIHEYNVFFIDEVGLLTTPGKAKKGGAAGRVLSPQKRMERRKVEGGKLDPTTLLRP